MKLLEEGATVLAMSDSLGYVFKPEGFTMADLEQVMAIKSRHSGKLRDFKAAGAQYVEGHKPWELNVPVDMAFPCATQHELNLEDATNLIKNGCKYVFEGANMPSTDRAIACFHKNGVIFGNGKAANAGGVAVSGLEMSQNRIGLQWSREEVEAKLTDIMNTIYRNAKAAAIEYNTTLDAGANVAAFLKVGEAVLAQGAV
jgi:glutamate dehydrogenase (NADP+)